MKEAIVGKKAGVTQTFDESGRVIPVTVVEAGPYVVVQKKTVETDGYDAIQVGPGELRRKLINKPKRGHFAKVGAPLRRTSGEFKARDIANYSIGDEIRADTSEIEDRVDVPGVSKGKGFRGTTKEWNASRGPVSHGSEFHRAPGSMGAASDPPRTLKNKGMPGHMKAKNTTVLNLKAVKIIPEESIILIRGGIPGPNRDTAVIRNSVKA